MVKVTVVSGPGNGVGYGVQGSTGDKTNGQIVLDCILTLSGNYGTAASHGDTLDFTNLYDQNGNSVGTPFSFGDYAPIDWSIKELLVAGSAPLGYQYNYNPGPTLAAPTQKGGVLTIVGGATASQDGGNEITEGAAYSGQSPSLAGAVLKARFYFVRL